MSPKPNKPKPVKRHTRLKYASVIAGLLILFVAANGALFVQGLGGISFSPASSVGKNIQFVLSVPNGSYVPVDGRVVTRVYDPYTKQLLASADNRFHMAPSATSLVQISMPYTPGPSDQTRVTMYYYIGAFGAYLPFPVRAVDLTVSPPG